MIYKNFGATGKKVSAVGVGGMRFKYDEYKKDNKICAELIHHAFKKGVTYFDTGPGYCDDHSEAIFGEAFKTMKYGEFYISTKCGLWQAQDADGVRRMIEKSIKILNVPKITFYNMWCIMSMDDYKKMTKKGGVYDGIVKAKEEGLVEHICCTVHTNGSDTAQIVRDGRIEGITLGYNAINFAYRREGIKACADANIGVAVMNPLGGGTIPKYEKYFKFLTEGKNDGVVPAALKFLVAHEEISTAVVGITTKAHIDEAVSIFDSGGFPVVDENYIRNLSKKLKTELDALCTGCSYCDSCPEGVPIPKLMEAYNEFILSGGENEKLISNRLNYHWDVKPGEAKKCTGCGNCEGLCTQKLPIIERMEKIAGCGE